MDTLTSIKVFRQIVESGTFVAAAERLDMSTAMVSKHVMHVEKRLGVRLLNRNSRTLSLTEPGRLYFERCKTILDDLEATEMELGSLGSAPKGTLRITAPNWGNSLRIADLLAEYRRRFPEVVVDISFEDRHADLVEEGIDLGLRVVTAADALPSGLIARALRSVHFYLAASRDYLDRRGEPTVPEELAEHDFLAPGALNELAFETERGRTIVPLRVVLRYRSMGGVANAAVAGMGLAPIPAMLFEDPAYKNVLVPVLPAMPVREATLYAVYVSRRYVPLKIRTFVDFLIEQISKTPEHDPRSPTP